MSYIVLMDCLKSEVLRFVLFYTFEPHLEESFHDLWPLVL